MTDKVVKDRQAKGERNGRAKLTEAAVDEIRGSPLGVIALAKKFGVHRNTIYHARKGRNWKFSRI